MNPGLRASASGMRAQQTRIDAIANNLANVNTTSFKRSRTNFEDMLYETLQGSQLVHYQGTETLAPIQIGRGVRLADIQRIHTQGAFEVTNNPFDFAIEGEGFFQVQLPNGTTGYTRDGTFTRAADSGALVTHAGHLLMPEINVPPEAVQVSVSPTGNVSAILGTSGEQVELGQLELARFANPSGLLSLGGNLYQQTPASGDAMTRRPDGGRLRSGGAGFAGGLQRGNRAGDGGHDHRPASLRGQLQGDQDRRRDDPDRHQRADPLMRRTASCCRALLSSTSPAPAATQVVRRAGPRGLAGPTGRGGRRELGRRHHWSGARMGHRIPGRCTGLESRSGCWAVAMEAGSRC